MCSIFNLFGGKLAFAPLIGKKRWGLVSAALHSLLGMGLILDFLVDNRVKPGHSVLLYNIK